MIEIKQIQIQLRDAITNSGLSQSQIALQLNVNPSTISKYLRLDKFPTIETFANLCRIIGVSSDEILCLNNL